MTTLILAVAESANWFTEFLAKMSTESLSVLIGGAIGIGLLKSGEWLMDKYPPQKTSRARRKILNGQWRGRVVQLERRASVPHEIDIDFEFEVGWRTVQGKMEFDSFDPQRGKVVNKFRGRFLTDDVMMLEYEKHERAVVGFGAILFRHELNGKTLNGKMVGLSSHINDLFVTKMTLNKV